MQKSDTAPASRSSLLQTARKGGASAPWGARTAAESLLIAVGIGRGAARGNPEKGDRGYCTRPGPLRFLALG